MKNDIRNLDLNLLKALDALLDEGSVTRAAQRLSLTQPAVSGMLTRLRDYFGDPLFVRTSHGMVATLRASELALPVKQILTDIAILLKPLDFEPIIAELTYTIAATDYALKAVVIPLMAALKQRAPRVKIAVRSVDSERIYQQLSRGAVDLALLTPQTTPDDLHGRTLYEEHYVCLARSHHPLAAIKNITLKQFCEQEHILVSTEGKFSGVTDEALAELKLTRRVGMSVNSFLVIPDILRLTNMIAVVPRRMVPADSDMAIIPLPLNVPGFSKSMAWHERTHRDPAHQWIRTLCLEVSQQHAVI
ncbi:LysR family transcriptional regulator [Erwinia tasmaniensis]|uniref:Regulatory protein, LysR n=1 Tax=Erwinia tasmaniensis (strain DSM 17950 / CFBP 7177 / CIP 109463 / NCPPB 4357 / Et1/99) TaxID=465817 RepID=B2VJC9_ERWT9|nr:LysR family transcriptional regulator [Erwinia tasmaniensis]CAO96500.1 regulatory protein, LysR [Erwinia tasmaniensis Et1/99]